MADDKSPTIKLLLLNLWRCPRRRSARTERLQRRRPERPQRCAWESLKRKGLSGRLQQSLECLSGAGMRTEGGRWFCVGLSWPQTVT